MDSKPGWKFLFNIFTVILVFSALNYAFGGEIDRKTNETEATIWIKKTNRDLSKFSFEHVDAVWNYFVNMTNETKAVQVKHNLAYWDYLKKIIPEAKKFDWKHFNDTKLRRMYKMLVEIYLTELSIKINKLAAEMRKIFNAAKLCFESANQTSTQDCPNSDFAEIMATSNDTDREIWVWKGWRDAIGKQMLEKFEELVPLINEAVQSTGYEDVGDYWRSWYESPTLREDCEALWQEIKPFYEQLHAYLRRKLMEKYPKIKFPGEGHIPAHLFGDMWARSWGNMVSLLTPAPDAQDVDITEELIRQNYTALKLFQLSDNFFKSLGLIPMPESFWNNSMIEKPTDREVLCHAQAWDFFNGKDFRISLCTELTTGYFLTVYERMARVQYFMQYKNQPFQFKGGANPAFHDAIADVIFLSVATPDHLIKTGLLKDYNDCSDCDLNFLMYEALHNVVNLPFRYLVDKWRWEVFAGNISRSQYNSIWWNYRCKYQGVYPPVARSESDFDPGSTYYVANGPLFQVSFNTSFIRRSARQPITLDLYIGSNPTCNIENSKKAGNKLADLMKLGSSQPWQIPFKKFTGTDRMSAKPLLNYFKPLIDWLKKQNKGQKVGWEDECPSGSCK